MVLTCQRLRHVLALLSVLSLGAQAAPPNKRQGDPLVGTWLWKFPDDKSIWGPESVEFKPDGVAAFSRDKTAATWQREENGRYLVKLANGEACRLTMVDTNHLDGLYLTGLIVKPTREGAADEQAPAQAADPAPAAAAEPPPAAAVEPPPPPPAPVVEGNASRLIKTDKRTYKKGEPVVVSYFGLPGGSTDWTNVARADLASDEWGDWAYASGANGQRTVKNLKPGEYEARAYFNGTTNLEDKVAFTIVP